MLPTRFTLFHEISGPIRPCQRSLHCKPAPFRECLSSVGSEGDVLDGRLIFIHDCRWERNVTKRLGVLLPVGDTIGQEILEELEFGLVLVLLVANQPSI